MSSLLPTLHCNASKTITNISRHKVKALIPLEYIYSLLSGCASVFLEAAVSALMLSLAIMEEEKVVLTIHTHPN